ncbi:MAG TPA: hypothetical protein VLU25_15130 [Acidobacteriota bacterium]|nr:hypothetical protein [Acidobacteriota bacterium]
MPSRKNIRRIDLFGTFINLVGLAIGLALMYYNYPDEAFIAIALSIIIYAFARVAVGYYDIESEEVSKPNGKPSCEPLTSYKAETTFKKVSR